MLIEGHTDTTGETEANDVLSLGRAETVRDLLMAAGLQATFVRVVGRGERDLRIPTGDEVDDPQNRRVEVTIR